MKLLTFYLLTCIQTQMYLCNHISVSWTKCLEYGKAVYTYEHSPVLSTKTKTNKVSQCGIVSVPLIVGGTAASEKEFPHMAIIGFGHSSKSKLHWDCGGSLISELFVLTAGHCLESRQLGPAQMVRLGLTHLEIFGYNLQERLIDKKIPHPSYKHPLKHNDIALVKLQTKVLFTPYVRPACLNMKEVEPGHKPLAIGFGKLSYESETGSKNLMKVMLEVYLNDKCAKLLSHHETMTKEMICAGHMAGGKDTCQGDSGGPLQTVLKTPYCMYSIIGITSFGKFCGFANSPAVYTKISSYVLWIEGIVWK